MVNAGSKIWVFKEMGVSGQEGQRRPLIAGNWKMNGRRADGLALAEALGAWAKERQASRGSDMLVCPPATLLGAVSEVLAGSWVAVGGQDCHGQEKGAHTGDISAAMLADAGASAVLVGHSERRQDHGESDSEIRAKAVAALGAGLQVIVCIGETGAERDSGQTLAVLSRQLSGSVPVGEGGLSAGTLVVAYEPVWAIGTGRTPSREQIIEAHSHIRAALGEMIGDMADGVRLLYGGSVKPENAAEILALANVDGALVGGASLKAEGFCAIYDAAT